MKVYAHEVLYCRYEGSWSVMGLYLTKKAAWLAMRGHLVESFNRVREEWLLFGRSAFERGGGSWMYREYEFQRVKEYEVKE